MVATGMELGKLLYEAGVVPDNCRRVIVDIPVDGCVTVYYETYTSSKIVQTLLQGPALDILKRAKKQDAECAQENSDIA